MTSSIRGRLTCLIAGLLAPLLLIAAAGGYAAYRSERQATEAMLLDTARALALGVDREVGKAEVFLRVLSHSRSLARGDLADFHAYAASALVDAKDTWITLFSPDGAVHLTTVAPYGTPMPSSRRPEAIARVAETRKPELSGVFVGPYTKRTMISLTVPVVLDGEVRYVLGMALSSELFMRLVAELHAPSSWIVSVMDRDGRFLARSRGMESFAGQQTSARFRAVFSAKDEGAVESVSMDGTPILASFARSSNDALTAVISYPLAEFDGIFRRALWWVVALAAVALLGLAVAVCSARAITRPMRHLVLAARRLGAGGPVRLRPTGLRELDLLQTELAAAAGARQEAEDRLRENEVRLRLAMEVGEIGAWEYDMASGHLTTSAACKAMFGRPTNEVFTWEQAAESLGAEHSKRLQEASKRALAEGGGFELDHEVTWPNGSLHLVQTRGRVFEREGATRFIGVCQDVTAERQAKAQQELLLHELNHRVKNTLATVQAMATMTFRPPCDPDVARETFVGRILGMAKTHDLLTATQWEGASLRDLLLAELGPYQDLHGKRVHLRGKPVMLGTQATLALGLAVHELATNASKYGALSVPEGRLSVRWRTVRIEGEPHLLIEWAESNGPPVTPPTRQGFGSRLIQRGLAQDLGGEIKLNFAAAGLFCVITFPLNQVVDSEGEQPTGARVS